MYMCRDINSNTLGMRHTHLMLVLCLTTYYYYKISYILLSRDICMRMNRWRHTKIWKLLATWQKGLALLAQFCSFVYSTDSNRLSREYKDAALYKSKFRVKWQFWILSTCLTPIDTNHTHFDYGATSLRSPIYVVDLTQVRYNNIIIILLRCDPVSCDPAWGNRCMGTNIWQLHSLKFNTRFNKLLSKHSTFINCTTCTSMSWEHDTTYRSSIT